MQSIAISSGTNLYAWVYTRDLVAIARGSDDVGQCAASVSWAPVTNGTYRVAFCSTKTGQPIKQQDFRTENGVLGFQTPPFEGDIAIRVSPVLLAQ